MVSIEKLTFQNSERILRGAADTHPRSFGLLTKDARKARRVATRGRPVSTEKFFDRLQAKFGSHL